MRSEMGGGTGRKSGERASRGIVCLQQSVTGTNLERPQITAAHRPAKQPRFHGVGWIEKQPVRPGLDPELARDPLRKRGMLAQHSGNHLLHTVGRQDPRSAAAKAGLQK